MRETTSLKVCSSGPVCSACTSQLTRQFPSILAVSNHQQTEWRPKCLSYTEVPFDQPASLGGLFHNVNRLTVFSAIEEVDDCPFL